MADDFAEKKISPRALNQYIREGTGLTLIDVLPEANYKAGHLPGAFNACVYEVVFLSKVNEYQPDHNAEVVVYGNGADTMEAEVAVQKLVRAGYTDVSFLDGGISAWLSAGFSVDSGDGAYAPPWSPSLPLADGGYGIDIGESRIEWTGRNANGKHFGEIRLGAGRVDILDGAFTGTFEIDMTTITDTDLRGDPYYQVLIDHLHSDDFFFVTRFPRAYFHLNGMTPLGEGAFASPNYMVTGDLELLGIRHGITFPAIAAPTEEGRVIVTAHFDIDRTRWGIIYGADRFFAHLGRHLVYDAIGIELRLVAAAVS